MIELGMSASRKPSRKPRPCPLVYSWKQPSNVLRYCISLVVSCQTEEGSDASLIAGMLLWLKCGASI